MWGVKRVVVVAGIIIVVVVMMVVTVCGLKKQGKFKYKRFYCSLAQISATCTAPIIYNSGTTTLSCKICWTSRHCRHVVESVTNAQL